eukprot:Colp12_sorted_trinity150504_noHs@9515
MVVCQFYLRGQCKFGSKCINEHTGAGSTTSAFGGNSSNRFSALANVGEGSQSKASVFGAKQASPAGQTGGSVFGQSGSAFKSPGAGASGTQTSVFGQPTTQSVFGQPAAQTSAFGQPATQTSAIGQPATQTSAIGQPATQTSAFGQSAAQTSAFGQPATPTSAFGQSATQTSTFGQPASFGTQQGGGSVFGSKPSAFSSSAAGSTGGSVFGAKPAGASGFGSSTGSTTNSVFGGESQKQPVNSAFGAGQAGTSVFGGAATNTTSTNNGGANSVFGSSARQGASSVFGNNGGVGGNIGGSVFGGGAQGNGGNTGATAATGASGNEFIEDVQPLKTDAEKKSAREALRSEDPEWPLSCFAMNPGQPSVIHGDYSPEEARYEAYRCKQETSNYNNYVQMMQKRQAAHKYMRCKLLGEPTGTTQAPQASFDIPEDEMDENFKCPITCSIMVDPVTAQDGHTYEREAIEKWFSLGKRISPMTGTDLKNTTLIPNHSVRSSIQAARDKAKARAAVNSNNQQANGQTSGQTSGQSDAKGKAPAGNGLSLAPAAVNVSADATTHFQAPKFSWRCVPEMAPPPQMC